MNQIQYLPACNTTIETMDGKQIKACAFQIEALIDNIITITLTLYKINNKVYFTEPLPNFALTEVEKVTYTYPLLFAQIAPAGSKIVIDDLNFIEHNTNV